MTSVTHIHPIWGTLYEFVLHINEVELADIFRSQANIYLRNHKLCPEQLKAFNAIMQCRTAALGGHIDYCENCGYTTQSYNSCRNRNCTKCQFVKKAQWVDKLASNLPPVKHFHIVFTIHVMFA